MPNKWATHCAEFAREHKVSLRQAMSSSECKASYAKLSTTLPKTPSCGCGGGFKPPASPCGCSHGAGLLTAVRKLHQAKNGKQVGRVLKSAVHEAVGVVTAAAGDKSLTNASQDVLRRFGNQTILRIRIARTPLSPLLMGALGTLQRDIKERIRGKSYDDLFHLRLDLQLASGKWVSTEKDGLVRISANAPLKRDTETLEADPAAVVSLNQLIDYGRKHMGDRVFFGYDAIKNNCQRYVDTLLTASSLNTSELRAFVVQDVSDILTKRSHGVARAVTDLAGVALTVADRTLL